MTICALMSAETAIGRRRNPKATRTRSFCKGGPVSNASFKLFPPLGPNLAAELNTIRSFPFILPPRLFFLTPSYLIIDRAWSWLDCHCWWVGFDRGNVHWVCFWPRRLRLVRQMHVTVAQLISFLNIIHMWTAVGGITTIRMKWWIGWWLNNCGLAIKPLCCLQMLNFLYRELFSKLTGPSWTLAAPSSSSTRDSWARRVSPILCIPADDWYRQKLL